MDVVAAHDWVLDADGKVRGIPKPNVRAVKSNAAFMREAVEPSPRVRESKAPTHGKYYTYVKHKCRCDECSAASREYERSRYERKNELRRGVPRKPPTPEQRERKNALQRAKRKANPSPPRVLTAEQKARRNERARERRAERRARGE
jgi:hypothetical protein